MPEFEWDYAYTHQNPPLFPNFLAFFEVNFGHDQKYYGSMFSNCPSKYIFSYWNTKL